MLLSALAARNGANPPAARTSTEPFGTTPEGEQVYLYTLRNARGMTVRVTNYGGIILSIAVPDREGVVEDVTLGFDALAPYLEGTPYLGALVGRYANRIANATFSLDGETYALAANNGRNHLHGGLKGFDKVVWNADPFETTDAAGLVLTRRSADMEEGYPGNLDLRVTYTLTDENALVFDYEAATDRATPVNLTQHTYFNLAGDDRADILGHVLTLHADAFTPIDATLIPTGELRPVAGTPLDFTTPTAVGERIGQADEQLRLGGGYDHNWVLDRADAGTLKPAARLYEPTSGRVLEVLTTEPGIQFYSGNFLDGSLTGRGGHVYAYRTGLALETQHFPDSPNQPGFPSTILHPGETYRSRSIYRFTVQPGPPR